MARRFEDVYRVLPRDNLGDPAYWNRRFEDIDRRVHQNEASLSDLDAVADRVEGVALDRMNNVLVPLTQEAVNRLTSIATIFQASSASEITVGVGLKQFLIPEGQRLTFAPLTYMIAFFPEDLNVYLMGRVQSYDSATGNLVLDVIQFGGEGDYAQWDIAPVAFVSSLQSLATAASEAAVATAADRVAVGNDKAAVIAEKALVIAARNQAEGFAGTASTKADEAVSSAGAAAAAAETAASHAASINPVALNAAIDAKLAASLVSAFVKDSFLGAEDPAAGREALGAAPTASPTFTGQVTLDGQGNASFVADRNSGTNQCGIEFRTNGVTEGYLHIGDDRLFYLWDASGGGFTRWASDASGNFVSYGNVTAYSDERLKTDIASITDALAKVKKLRGVTFKRNGIAGTGVVAQEVREIIPEVVMEDGEGMLSVAYGNLVGVLIEAVKELSARVEALEK